MFIAAFILSYASAVSILLPFVGVVMLAKRTRKEKLNSDIFYISIYILVMTLAQALLFVFAKGPRNYFLFNVFYPLEFAVFLYLILQWFDEIKKYSLILAACILLNSYAVAFITQSFNEFPSMFVFIESAIIIPFTFNSVLRMVKTSFDNYRLTMFKGILFYSLGSIIMVGFLKSSMHEANIIHSILNIYANCLFFKSFTNYGR